MQLFIGSTQCTTRVIAGTLKGVFERLRPFEVIQAGDWDWKFFSGHGNSFPSGHSAHFWGLFFPLAYLFPRYRIPLSIIPLFISVARVGVNDHWCSDVIVSMAIAAIVTLLFIAIFRMKPVQNAKTPIVIPRSPRRPRDLAVEVRKSQNPNPRRSLKISKLQRMASATSGIETLGFPWDLVLGVWDFHSEALVPIML